MGKGGGHLDCWRESSSVARDVVGKDNGSHRSFPRVAFAHEEDLLGCVSHVSGPKFDDVY